MKKEVLKRFKKLFEQQKENVLYNDKIIRDEVVVVMRDCKIINKFFARNLIYARNLVPHHPALPEPLCSLF